MKLIFNIYKKIRGSKTKLLNLVYEVILSNETLNIENKELKKKIQVLEDNYNKVDIKYVKKYIEETKRSHVENMELANKEIDELTDKISGLSEEYQLKRKELDAEIEPLNSLLELKEDKIVELINNDKVFLSKRISEKSVKKFLEPFQGWLDYNTRYGFCLLTDIPGNKSKIWWPTVEKILFDALKLDRKYQLKFKQQASELNDFKQREETLAQREEEFNQMQQKITDQILKLGIVKGLN